MPHMPCGWSVRQTIHIKWQISLIFSGKKKKKKKTEEKISVICCNCDNYFQGFGGLKRLIKMKACKCKLSREKYVNHSMDDKLIILF